MVKVKTFKEDDISEKLSRKLTGPDSLDDINKVKMRRKAILFVQKEFDKLKKRIDDLEEENKKLKLTQGGGTGHTISGS